MTRLLLDLKMTGRLELSGLLHKGLGSHCPCHKDHLCQEITLGELSLKDLVVFVVWVFYFVFLTMGSHGIGHD